MFNVQTFPFILCKQKRYALSTSLYRMFHITTGLFFVIFLAYAFMLKHLISFLVNLFTCFLFCYCITALMLYALFLLFLSLCSAIRWPNLCTSVFIAFDEIFNTYQRAMRINCSWKEIFVIEKVLFYSWMLVLFSIYFEKVNCVCKWESGTLCWKYQNMAKF